MDALLQLAEAFSHAPGMVHRLIFSPQGIGSP